MSDRAIKVTCPTHGESFATFVCQHLAHGAGRGFFSADDGTGADPCPDAWCAECDSLLMAKGKWDEESEAFAGITLLCAGCYAAVKQRNLVREGEGGDKKHRVANEGGVARAKESGPTGR